MKSLRYRVMPGGTLRGNLRVPGDKSISHRSIMLGALSEGVTEVTGFLEGEDSLATLQAFRDMGVNISGPTEAKVRIEGVGMHGLQAPAAPLDLGNSGTSMRLLSGLLVGQSFDSVLLGDGSLSARPMRRVMDPLTTMGARIHGTEKGTAPLHIQGNTPLRGFSYPLPMASAQVKSCLLLAGMYAEGRTCVTEPAITRDHTERMLRGLGYPLTIQGSTICLQGGGRLQAMDVEVPGDISSAAFFLVGAAIAKEGDICLQHVGLNPTRTGVISILEAMGAEIEKSNPREIGGEPVADLRIRASRLKGIQIPEEYVPLAIDEFPALFIAAACAEGETLLTGAEELRVKESDRIQVMVEGLQVLGIDAQARPDGIRIVGGQMGGGEIDSHGDHRIAMAFSMASLRAAEMIEIDNCANVETSFPRYPEQASRVGLSLEVLA